MRSLSWLKGSSVYLVIFAVAAALPAYLVRFMLGPFPTTLLEAVIIIAIITVITKSAAAKQIRNLFANLKEFATANKLLTIGSVLILVATVVGIIVSPDKRGALGIAKAYFWEPMALAWLIIATKPDRKKIRRAALGGFAVGAVIVIIYGLIQYAYPSLIPATWTAERRITSVFDFPNAAALYLAPLVPLFLSIPFGTVIALFAILIIILAKSAGGLSAVAAALFFLGLLKKRTRLTAVVVAAAVALVILLAPQAAGLRDQILMRDWSGRVHQIGWKESLAMLKDHPLFGAGLDGFRTVVAPYHKAQGVEIFQYPHNIFLTIWSELGLLGLAGFILVLVWFFKKAYLGRSQRHALCLAATILAVLVHGLVDVPYFKNDLAMMFWLFLILMAL